jgi:hypothetical protein
MCRQKLSFAPLCFALLVIAALPGQRATAARVTIHVTDQAGVSVAKAEIRLIPPPASSKTKLTSDDKGEVSLELKPGGYGLFIEDPGFKKFVTHLEVRESKEAQTLPVVLQIGNTGSPTVYPPSFKDALRLEAFPYHETVMLKPAELQAMPHKKVTVHNPHTNADDIYSGIPLADLFTRLGAPLGKEFSGIALTSYLVATGSDGYQALLALAEVDPSLRTGEVLVADTVNGHPLDAKSGPFKLVVTEDKQPTRWVRNLACVELKYVD